MGTYQFASLTRYLINPFTFATTNHRLHRFAVIRFAKVVISQNLSHRNLQSCRSMSQTTTTTKTMIGSVSQQVSSQVRVSILGNGANANPISIVVGNDRETFLINCGEGVQRLVFEHKIRLGKIRHVLFSSAIHENFSGFFGFLLTMAPTVAPIESGSSDSVDSRANLHVYGPSKIGTVAQIYDEFMYHAKNVKIAYHFVDRQIGEVLNEQKGFDPKPLLDDIDLRLYSATICASNDPDRPRSVAYIFVLKDKPGQLLVQKCKQFRVPPGPLFAKLKSGHQIELENGTIVRPEDVLGPAEIGPSFVVLECPTEHHIESLRAYGSFERYRDGKPLEFVIHITPTDVFEHDRYREWLTQFDRTTKHILLNRDNRNQLCLVSSSIFQAKLDRINDNVFRALRETFFDFEIPVNGGVNESVIIRDCPTQLTYVLRPARDRGFSFNPDCYRLNANKIAEQAVQNDEFVRQLETYRKRVNSVEAKQSGISDSSSVQSDSPNILFLGTGSATPGKLRNTSAILINLRERRSSILFDCGEATFLQLARFYGSSELYGHVLRSIGAIFISHVHADHHFGLIRVIRERSKLQCDEPVTIIAPHRIGEFLRNYSAEIDDRISPHYRFIACSKLAYRDVEQAEDFQQISTDSSATETSSQSRDDAKRLLLSKLDLADLATVEVPHCHDSHGIVITLAAKQQSSGNGDCDKIVYSGDCTLSNAFDRPGKDCLLLIHEATMNDDLREEAIAKRHSTISDAIRAGFNCNARYTMLTHFSQRYAKIAPLALIEHHHPSGGDDDNDRRARLLSDYIENRVAFAFDFMHLDLRHLWKTPKLKPVLDTLFAAEIQEIQDIQTKKALKRKLIDAVVRPDG